MKLLNAERRPGSVAVLTVEVGSEEFAPALEQSVKRNTARITVPGFRRGKAPRKMIEKMYGTGVFLEDAVEIAYPKAFQEAADEAGVIPLERADVSIKELGEEGFTFEATVQVYPTVELGAYKGLKARRQTAEISDEDVDAEVERLRERNSALAAAERPAQMGDTVTLDFEGFSDGVPFPGGKSENHSLELGSGQFIPGFEEQVAGHSAGDAFSVNVTFPEQYHAEDLAGKDVVFECLLKEVKEKLTPELDDEFAKDVSEFNTVDELKADLRRSLLDNRQKELDLDFEERLVDQVVAGLKAELPQVMLDRQTDSLLQNFAYRLQTTGMTVDQYLSMTGMTVEEMRREYRPAAERQVKAALAFEAIAEAEGMEISEEEMEAEYGKLAQQYRMEPDRVRRSVPPESVRGDLLNLKAAQLVRDSAVEGDPDPIAEPPAEPPAETPAEPPAAEAPAEKPKPKRTKKAAAPAETPEGKEAPKARKTRTKTE